MAKDLLGLLLKSSGLLKIQGIIMYNVNQLKNPFYSFVLNLNRKVVVRWDSGKEFVYYIGAGIGAENAYELRVSRINSDYVIFLS